MSDEAQETTAPRPNMGHFVSTGLTTRLVREFIRETIVPEAVERLRAIGMGETEHPIPVVVPGGKHGPPRVEVIDCPAPPATQVQALSKLLDTGAPRPRSDAEGAKFNGIIVIGREGPELQQARQIAAQARISEHGLPPPNMDYRPPPGHQIMVIDEDLSGATKRASPDDAPPVVSTPKPLTKAQRFAKERQAKRQRKSS